MQGWLGVKLSLHKTPFWEGRTGSETVRNAKARWKLVRVGWSCEEIWRDLYAFLRILYVILRLFDVSLQFARSPRDLTLKSISLS
jgi:hypothetical protein